MTDPSADLASADTGERDPDPCRAIPCVLDRLAAALVRGDAPATFAEVLTSEYEFTSPAGEVGDRAAVLAALASGGAAFTAYAHRDVVVEAAGPGEATARGVAVGEGRNPGGEPFHGAHAFASAWGLVGGRWRLRRWRAVRAA